MVESVMHEIGSFEELVDTMVALHDCPFDLERSSFSEPSGSWTGVFLRPLWDDPRAKHRGVPFVYQQSKLPVAEAWLTITGVATVTIVEDQGIGRYSFNEVQRTADGISLCFNEQMRIDLHIRGSVSARYQERVLQGVQAVYRQFLLVQAGPTIEELDGGDQEA